MQAESLATIRRLRLHEEACFESLGRATGGDPATVIQLDVVARHHAWRAAQWAGLEAAGPEGEAPTWLEALLAPSVAAEGEGGALDRWATTTAVTLAAAYDRLADEVDAVSGGPVRRVAERCRADLELDRGEVRRLLAGDGVPERRVGG